MSRFKVHGKCFKKVLNWENRVIGIISDTEPVSELNIRRSDGKAIAILKVGATPKFVAIVDGDIGELFKKLDESIQTTGTEAVKAIASMMEPYTVGVKPTKVLNPSINEKRTILNSGKFDFEKAVKSAHRKLSTGNNG
jgi:hypothetical protein